MSFIDYIGIAFILMAVLTVWQTVKSKKKLGEVKRLTLGGFKYSDKSQIILVLLCLVLWVWSVLSDVEYALNSVFTYAFLVAMAILLLSNLIQLFTKPGFYTTGVATGSMITSYKDIRSYEVLSDKKDANILYIYFNGGSRFFSSTRLVIKKDELAEIKKLIKKECSLHTGK